MPNLSNFIKRVFRYFGINITYIFSNDNLLKLLKISNLSDFIKRVFENFGIKIIYIVKYPMTDIKLKVKHYLSFWNRLNKGAWEINCIRYFKENIIKEQIIFDIGAWIGPYTLLLSQLVGIKGSIVAFEPDSKAYNILLKNVKRNKLTNIKPEKIAVSDSIGESFLYLYGERGNSESSLISHNYKGQILEESIITTTIDNYCEENNIIPDGIKIDVEGAEMLVIKGAQHTIAMYSPWILLEFHGAFMSDQERQKNWEELSNLSEQIIFINGESELYSYGDRLNNLPDCNDFNIFLDFRKKKVQN